MKSFGFLFSCLVGVLLLAAGCAKPEIRCTAPEDNPEHHYSRGMELLEQMKTEEATAKFERALYCNEEYSPAHGGLAITTAMKANVMKPEGYREVDLKAAADHLRAAKKNAGTPEETFAYHLASMRVQTALKHGKWLEEAEQDFKNAMKLKVDEKRLVYYNGRESAIYFIGLAYLEAGEFQKARDRFADVLNYRAEGKWHAPADREWKRADKIVRALSGITVGDVGKRIARADAISRAEMAALIMDELKVEKLFAGRIPVASAEKKPGLIPADLANSPFRDEVLTVLKWGIRGLEPSFDETSRAYLYRPEVSVTRKEFALVLEDVIIKLAGDEKLASAFFGHEKSPFPDVPPASAWYNAIMNVTTRNIMETELSGEFRPNDPVDGAEALLAVRVLKQKLNIY